MRRILIVLCVAGLMLGGLGGCSNKSGEKKPEQKTEAALS